ncbi:MAG: PQQ-binding-like beta-propeller repeat protein [Bacteroidales bacterium]|nr:PQQ-binding-like beta-propeller repeat protein [Bacteroidales bacterium]
MNGISASSTAPLNWDESSSAWKTELRGKGYSSPVVYDNQVWLTSASADGKELYAICVDYQTGKLIHDIKVFTPETPIGKHSINTYASPTPCIEKGFVYVHFGSLGTACIRTGDGTVVWTRTDLKCKHVQGPGSSPILYKNLLILHYEGTDVRFITALDKKTGQEVWRTERPEEPYKALPNIGTKAYVTPLIIKVKGKDQMISNGSAACFAYDPNTGTEIWRVIRGAESTVPMPFYEDGIVYFYCGFMVDAESSNFTEMIAVNPDGKGDITATNVLWRKRDNQTQTQMLSPVIKGGLIYTINTRNEMQCIDAKSGAVVWQERQRSNFNSSPVWAGGNIWFGSVKGDVIAVRAGRVYEPLAQFTMESGIWATPAFLRNSVIVRTENFLYRFGR